MSSYDVFAAYYDVLTKNVDYAARAAYFCALLQKSGPACGITLDLACGTGSLTLELARRGFDVYGIDSSPAMLSVARQKLLDAGFDVLFLNQKMQSIDLYGTVDTVFCTLDSINHLPGASAVQKTFERVSLFMNPGGVFLFDVNTPYKHRSILGNQTFVYDTERVYCVWQNTFDEKMDKTRISLDFFEKDGNAYYRRTESFSEQAYAPAELVAMLEKAGFCNISQYADLCFDAPQKDTQRIVFIAHKPQ